MKKIQDTTDSLLSGGSISNQIQKPRRQLAKKKFRLAIQ